MKLYNPKDIEPKWQQVWADTGLHQTKHQSGAEDFYQLTMFPYPSGDLHVGHWYSLVGPDVLARYRRMNGKNVLFPMGWDAFGLPAENAAIKRGIPPAEWTRQNIERMKHQIVSMGSSFDWDKELSTADPSYYRWTQWLFLLLYKNGLAYKETGLQNWCPSCQTVLANEQVVGEDHVCERCDTPVEKKELEQWFFKITEYAEELLSGLDEVDWPEKIKTMQRDWIGKSEGVRIYFSIEDTDHQLEIYTTRPDTVYGATFMVLAPEHPLLDEITTQEQQPVVQQYKDKVAAETNVDRLEAEEKTGAFTGAHAIHPITDERIPIWVSDYVLMEYGSGAIMAVPAHDERDYDFAKKYELPVKTVIEPVTGEKQDNPQYRRSVVAIVENLNGYILSINWGEENGGNLFIGGGLEEDEDLVNCAKREIQEETGYKNVEFIDQTETIHHHYFAKTKNIPRKIDAVGMHFRLITEDQDDQKLEEYEKGKFKVEWISKKEADQEVVEPLHRYVFEKLILDKVYTGDGVVVNSGEYDGMDSADMRAQVTKDLEDRKKGEAATNYKIHDWLISRQRYWGAPIPIIYCQQCGAVPVPEEDLPVELPENVEFKPTGQSPLRERDDFVNTECPECSEPAQREVDTMDTFVDSSWYFLRFPDPDYEEGIFNPETVNRWLPVDHYTGGIEHAILHLLYARFITKTLRDYTGLGFSEPFQILHSQGVILGPDGHKMSKSRGNIINPDEVVESGYGADSFRTYLLFIGPWTEGGPFSLEGIAGVYRFMSRVWSLVLEYHEGEAIASVDNQSELEVQATQFMHKTIKKVTEDINDIRFNTAIAALMEYVNHLYKLKTELPPGNSPQVWGQYIGALLRLLAPFAPHITEELWQEIGQEESIHIEPWPGYDESEITDTMVTIAVQINDKTRDRITLPAGSNEEEISTQARKAERIAEELANKEIDKTIVVPDKLVNFVVS